MNIPNDNKLEKIYTPAALTYDMIRYLKDAIEKDDSSYKITEFLEPCAGAGAIYDILLSSKVDDSINFLAYDIYNETNRTDIIEADFLKLDIEYQKGRCIITNIPFHS